MTTSETSDRLAAARRIAELEGELARERARLDAARRRLTTKEGELLDIHRSRAWGVVSALRSLKYRALDPLLGLFGISWPRRRSLPTPSTTDADRPEPARPERYDVVCFSTCDWDARVQRPQQLMARFAAAGHRVFFVSQQFRADGPPVVLTRKQANVYEVTFRGRALNVYADRLDDASRDPLAAGLDALRREASVGAAAIVVQLPFWWPLARLARARFGWPLLYDCMDLHEGFATVRRAMAAQEVELLAAADVVIVSSEILERRALERRPEVLLLRNACDYAHFALPPKTRGGRPVIGYYGAISDWFDSALVAELAARRPDWDFLLIGSTYNGAVTRLARLPNVVLPGEEPYESLPVLVAGFDVGIIPFKRMRLTEATNPVKLYEMLAAGKPIVSVAMPEVAALAPLVRLASTAAEFEREIVAALAENPDAAQRRQAFAREQTWERRFASLAAVTAAAVSGVSGDAITR